MKKVKTEPIKTVLTITLGFTVIYLLTQAEWSILVALSVGFAGLFSPFLAGKINFAWMKLAYVLSLFIPNIILGIIYFLVLFPISTLQKLFGRKDPLILKNRLKSTFQSTDKSFTIESFEKPW